MNPTPGAMQRKLIQLSPSTAVVSLPARWIRSNGFRKGDPLTVSEEGDRLTVMPGKRRGGEIEIDVSALDRRLLWVAIDTAYITGYDKIRIRTKGREQAEFMTKAVRYFPGMIITDERMTAVEFAYMGTGEDLDLDKIISRIHNMNLALLDDAIAATAARDWEMLTDAKRRDYTINSYISLCVRKAGTGSPLRVYLKILEMFTDRICLMLLDIGKRRSQKERTFLQQLRSLADRYFRLHTTYSLKALVQLDAERRELLTSLKARNRFAIYATEALELLFEVEELEMELATARPATPRP